MAIIASREQASMRHAPMLGCSSRGRNSLLVSAPTAYPTRFVTSSDQPVFVSRNILNVYEECPYAGNPDNVLASRRVV